jgi:hypothetical protein
MQSEKGGEKVEGWKLGSQRQDGLTLWKRKPTTKNRRLDERMDDVETTYSYFHVFVLHFSVDKEESKKFKEKKIKKRIRR